MVRNLAKYCLRGKKRSRFQSVRDAVQPELKKAILPRLDVSTRWNSTRDAIARAIDLKNTILKYTATSASDRCPRFTPDTFKALNQILPVLEIFNKLTMRFSASDVTIHRVLPSLHAAITGLEKIKNNVADCRKASFQAAIDKLTKYITPMLENDWVCAAFALDPINKEEGLENLFGPSGYNTPGRKDAVVRFIRRRLQCYQTEVEEAPEDNQTVSDSEHTPPPFASTYQASPAASQQDPSADAWTEYNSKTGHLRFVLAEPKEHILQYWARQERINPRMRSLARVARDILSLAAASTDVERLFSHSANVLGRKRNLGPEMLLKQTCVKMWCSGLGFLNVKDVEEMLKE